MMISWEGWSGWLLCISHFTFHLPGKVAGWKCKLENLRIFERGTHSSSQLACYPVCGCEMSSFLRVYTYAVVNIVVLDEWIWREKKDMVKLDLPLRKYYKGARLSCFRYDIKHIRQCIYLCMHIFPCI